MPSALKECFGNQGYEDLTGDSTEKCQSCELFDRCHKMTVSICLQSLSCDLDLIVQNGLDDGRMKTFDKLKMKN